MGRILEDSLPAEEQPVPRVKDKMNARKASVFFLAFALVSIFFRVYGADLAETLQRWGWIP